MTEEESRMTQTLSTRPDNSPADRLNEKFQTLLREAAEERQAREQAHANENAIAARRESDSLLDLARAHPRGR